MYENDRRSGAGDNGIICTRLRGCRTNPVEEDANPGGAPVRRNQFRRE